MKTLEELKGRKTTTLDGRELSRLAQFIPFKDLAAFGLEAKEGVTEEEWDKTVKPFTKENVLVQLQSDVEFGFEKALNQRGLSAGMMFNTVLFWNQILEDGLENYDDDDYAMYGLPLFKATAVKYGWDNPIGDDLGSEQKYND